VSQARPTELEQRLDSVLEALAEHILDEAVTPEEQVVQDERDVYARNLLSEIGEEQHEVLRLCFAAEPTSGVRRPLAVYRRILRRGAALPQPLVSQHLRVLRDARSRLLRSALRCPRQKLDRSQRVARQIAAALVPDPVWLRNRSGSSRRPPA
jgi:hypothetical protein